MPAILLGRKVGMTRLFDQAGNIVPVTIIEAGPCFVSQVKTTQVDGYDAVQVAFEDVKPRNSTQPVMAHDAKAGLSPKRVHREFRLDAKEVGQFQPGQKLTVEILAEVKLVDVIGTSKGKGFQGTMKRWNHKGMCASHGTERKHRSPGSISGRATNRGFSGRPKKGLHMSGHLGDERVTARCLEVVGQDKDQNLLWVKGAVPGARQGLLVIRAAKRVFKGHAAKLAKAS